MRKIIALVLPTLLMSGCENKSYFYSPSKDRCITFIEHNDNPYLFYVMPGMHSKIPDNGYLLIRWTEDYNFDVNWSAKKYRFTYRFVAENTLDSTLVDFSPSLRPEETVIVNGESWYKFPEVEGFALPYITSGTYVKQRKRIYESLQRYNLK